VEKRVESYCAATGFAGTLAKDETPLQHNRFHPWEFAVNKSALTLSVRAAGIPKNSRWAVEMTVCRDPARAAGAG
jgi:hypothetical protein